MKHNAKKKTNSEKHNAKKKTNSEKHNAKFEGHNAEILSMFWTIYKQENHYTMDIKGIEISSAVDYKTDIRKEFRKMIFHFSIFRTDF